METLLLLTCITGVAFAERMPRLRFQPLRFARPSLGTDLLYMASGALGLGLLARTAAARLTDGSAPLLEMLSAWPWALAYALGLVLYDLCAYLTHSLLLHRISWLWRVHAVHHSTLALDWLAAFRAHVIEHALRHLTSAFALVLLGFPPDVVAVVAASFAAWAALGHANLELPLRMLEPVLITPRLHRLHHATSTCDANFGTIFSVWDRLCGTLVSDGATGPIGVPGRLDAYPQTWIQQLIEPFRVRTRPPPVELEL